MANKPQSVTTDDDLTTLSPGLSKEGQRLIKCPVCGLTGIARVYVDNSGIVIHGFQTFSHFKLISEYCPLSTSQAALLVPGRSVPPRARLLLDHLGALPSETPKLMGEGGVS